MNPLFPVLPDDLSALTREELSEALESHRDIARRIKDRDPDLLSVEAEDGTRTTRDAEEVIESFQQGVIAIQAIEAQLAKIDEDEAATAAKIDELANAAGVAEAPVEADEPADDEIEDKPQAELAAEVDEPEDERADVVDEPEAVAAAAAPPKRSYRMPPPASDRRPAKSDDNRAALVAAAGLEGVKPGTAMDKNLLGKAILDAVRNTTTMPEGMSQRQLVASVRYDYPRNRQLDTQAGMEAVYDQLMQVVGPDAKGIDPETGEEALIAAGGLCAPLTPIYELATFGTRARPVRDALAQFQATRGGIIVPTPLTIADVDDAVGVVTNENDELGGTFAAKTCQVLDCDPTTPYDIDAAYACVQWGNFQARTWPERVAAFAELVGVAHARLAEGKILTEIGTGSTAMTAAQGTHGYGAASALISQILILAAQIRSEHRIDPDIRLRALLPQWSRDLLAQDIVNGQFERFGTPRESVAPLLRRFGIEPTFYLDSATGKNQIVQVGAAGAIDKLPTDVVWYLFPEGTWTFLDGGTLDLGIVRDSVLNETNDFRVFYETFEGTAKIGPVSLEVTSSVCPSGTYGPAGTALTCS